MSFEDIRNDPRVVAKMTLMARLSHELCTAYGEVNEARGLSVAAIADAIGEPAGVIAERLNGFRNMRLSDLSDILHAMGCDIEIKIVPARTQGE